MEYYLNELDPVSFQRLVNSLLVARFGEDVRLTPLRGRDGGRDGEIAPGNPFFELEIDEELLQPGIGFQPPRKGRYLFQVKHHLTTDKRLSDARNDVIADFRRELVKNVLSRRGDQRVNYFFLITNVPGSLESQNRVDELRRTHLHGNKKLHVDIWWKEQLTAFLDQMPWIWSSFPEIFAGRSVPIIADVINESQKALSRALRMAFGRQYERDKKVKFRQIELEQELARLFIDLDVTIVDSVRRGQRTSASDSVDRYLPVLGAEVVDSDSGIRSLSPFYRRWRSDRAISALRLMVYEGESILFDKILLEGGPGQGKSTITQMIAQIYRQQLLKRDDIDPENRWKIPERLRLPFRIELREYAQKLEQSQSLSVEEYLASIIHQDSGGYGISPADIHTIVEKSPTLLIFDGLDEVGSDDLRDKVLGAILDCVKRFETELNVDLRVIVTSRPPGVAGRRDLLSEFVRLSIVPLDGEKVDEYLSRWLLVQIPDKVERNRIRDSFERRCEEPHVEVLARNPMQLSVLLQFIRLKGEAFPDRRAELYRDYFQIVIDRDVEKSPDLRENREVIEALHEFLGYKLHSLTEVNQADRTLERKRLLKMVDTWLDKRGDDPHMASRFFKLGEERFGLIVTPKGEGRETRYGFEVQPVQEYFAAAYISNQIEGNAHDVFERMLRRSYWKEVALFLAGLRRRNEKADLIARARHIDDDQENGWRQDGRSIVLQLLEEGVFSEPPYVFSLALDLMIDLLDVNLIPVQSEPEGFASSLRILVQQGGTAQHQERLKALLREYRGCEDVYVLSRLHRVAGRTLSKDSYFREISSYEGESPEVISRLRLEWPCLNGINLADVTTGHEFWSNVPDPVWASLLWTLTLHSGVACKLPIPPRFHQLLILQFATHPASALSGNVQLKTNGFVPDWAIWRLARNQQLLFRVWTGFHGGSEKNDDVANLIESSIDRNANLSTEGLDDEHGTAISELVETSGSLVLALLSSERDVAKAFADYTKSLIYYIERPGLLSWVAGRCAMNLLDCALLGYSGGRMPERSRHFEDLSRRNDWNHLVAALQPLYDSGESRQTSRDYISIDLPEFVLGKSSTLLLGSVWSVGSTPNRIRLTINGDFVPIADILSKTIIENRPLTFEWMTDMVLTTEIVRPLVERCRKDLRGLLQFLARRRIIHSGFGKPLVVQDTQRILKVARNSDDQNIFAGAIIALSESRYIRLAGEDLLSKLLQVDPDYTGVAALLFSGGGLRRDLEPDEIGIVLGVAERIRREPQAYPLGVVCAAADYLVEHRPSQLPPLHDLERELGIVTIAAS